MNAYTHNNRMAVANLAAQDGAETIVEIGVRRGRLSVLLAKVPTVKELYLIDSWEHDEPIKWHPADATKLGKNARSVKRWAKKQNADGYWVEVLHMPSAKAVAHIPDRIDFIYIDGDHSYEGVKADIRDYLPKVRSGGILCGDDYDLPGVGKAVDELIDGNPRVIPGFIPGTRQWWARIR